MKIQHRYNAGFFDRRSAAVDDDYERQVQRATAKNERLYAKAQRRLDEAKARLEKQKKAKAKKHLIAELETLVEQRLDELHEYELMMTGSSAGAQHRGDKSFRPVPKPKRL